MPQRPLNATHHTLYRARDMLGIHLKSYQVAEERVQACSLIVAELSSSEAAATALHSQKEATLQATCSHLRCKPMWSGCSLVEQGKIEQLSQDRQAVTSALTTRFPRLQSMPVPDPHGPDSACTFGFRTAPVVLLHPRRAPKDVRQNLDSGPRSLTRVSSSVSSVYKLK